MREPSLQKTTTVSLLLHLVLLALSVVLINYTRNVVLPSPYTVSLVNPEESGQAGSSRRAPASTAAEKETPVESKTKEKEMPVENKTTKEKELHVKESKTMIDANKKNDQKILDNRINSRIAEIASKKTVERIVKLRSVISVQGSGIKSPVGPADNRGAAGGSKGSLFDSYYGKITDEIRGEWVYPDMGKKNLEAIVSVLIRRDGSITVQGVEKSSGDLFFDRSALKAVTKASPVSPPPYEMEIGIRFYP